ncbi:MAG TPA: hypothetical protein VGE77_07925 [Nocardioides sp.]
MKRTILATLTTLSLATLAACGGSDDDASGEPTTEEARTGVLANSEFGLADGSTTEVPFDDSVLSGGPQESLTTPATVLTSGITPDAEEIDFVAEVEIEAITPGSIEDFDLDAAGLETVGDAVPYYIASTARYVNGPVAQQPDVAFFDVLDAAGASMDSGVFLTFGTLPADACDDVYKAQAFGEGAQARSCSLVFLNPGEPASIAWDHPSAGEAPGGAVTWPIG